MKIEVGKFYRTQRGTKAECVEDDGSAVPFCVVHSDGLTLWHKANGNTLDGGVFRKYNIIAEWEDDVKDAAADKPGPVRMRPEIVPGVYGSVEVSLDAASHGVVGVYVNSQLTPDELAAAIATLTEIHNAMKENA